MVFVSLTVVIIDALHAVVRQPFVTRLCEKVFQRFGCADVPFGLEAGADTMPALESGVGKAEQRAQQVGTVTDQFHNVRVQV